jgi:hypothetical protein
MPRLLRKTVETRTTAVLELVLDDGPEPVPPDDPCTDDKSGVFTTSGPGVSRALVRAPETSVELHRQKAG